MYLTELQPSARSRFWFCRSTIKLEFQQPAWVPVLGGMAAAGECSPEQSQPWQPSPPESTCWQAADRGIPFHSEYRNDRGDSGLQRKIVQGFEALPDQHRFGRFQPR